MSELYKLEVFADGPLSKGEVSTWMSSGKSVVVEGAEMVMLPHGVIVKADGFFPDKGHALVQGAARVADVGRKILDQASEMLAKAREESRKAAEREASNGVA